MQASKTVLKQSAVDVNNYVYDELVVSENKQYVISKMWYKPAKTAMTSFVQTSKLEIFELTKSDELVMVFVESNANEFYEKLDHISLEFAKKSDLIKTFDMKNVQYRTTVNEVQIREDQTINMLKLKVLNATKPTAFYFSNTKEKKELKFNDVRELLVPGTEVRLIIEIDALVVDLINNRIFTNLNMRQVCITKRKPMKLELTEYSFLDSDNEDTSSEQSNNNVEKSNEHHSNTDSQDRKSVKSTEHHSNTDSQDRKSVKSTESHESNYSKNDSDNENNNNESDNNESDNNESDNNESESDSDNEKNNSLSVSDNDDSDSDKSEKQSSHVESDNDSEVEEYVKGFSKTSETKKSASPNVKQTKPQASKPAPKLTPLKKGVGRGGRRGN
jgi:hypothetical protein